jgi:hypothetical protein
MLSTGEAIRKVLDSRSAFICPYYAIDPPILSLNYSDVDVCTHVSRLPLEGPPRKSSMFINKTSPLKEVFNYK